MAELFHWEPNGACLAALMTLHEKEAAFKARYVDFLALEQAHLAPFTEPDEAVLNQEFDGPVLTTADGPVTDSFFMGIYIDQTLPGAPVAPSDPVGHYAILAWARHVGITLAPAITTLGCREVSIRLSDAERLRLARGAAQLPGAERQAAWAAFARGTYSDDLIADCRRKIGLSVGAAESALVDGPWLLGKQFSLADIGVFAYLKNVLHLTPDLIGAGEAPRVRDWIARLSSRPSYAQALEHARSTTPEWAFVPGPEHSRWG